jgi:hypothetical protein
MKIPLIHSISLLNHHQITLRQVCFILQSNSFESFLLDNQNLLFNHQTSSANSRFYTDPFDIVAPPSRQTDSPLNMISSNNNSTFYYQPTSQFVPSRAPPPVPIATPLQRPITLKHLSLNPIINTSNDISTDLLDLGDPGSPPPSPKFDPYG